MGIARSRQNPETRKAKTVRKRRGRFVHVFCGKILQGGWRGVGIIFPAVKGQTQRVGVRVWMSGRWGARLVGMARVS